MAWKHRQRRANTNDIIDPEDWTANLREFADEVNGNLDRDNFKERVIEPFHVKQGTFNKVRVVRSTNDYILDGNTTAFSTSMLTQELVESVNGMIIVEASGTFYFNHGVTWTKDPHVKPEGPLPRVLFKKNKTANTPDQITNEGFQTVTVRILVDGVEVGRCHSIPEFTALQSYYVCGAVPIETGSHRIEIEAKTAIVNNYLGGEEVSASEDGSTRSVRFYHQNLVTTVRRR
jgi:hypothetical protein